MADARSFEMDRAALRRQSPDRRDAGQHIVIQDVEKMLAGVRRHFREQGE
jgi:hypothetical protein